MLWTRSCGEKTLEDKKRLQEILLPPALKEQELEWKDSATFAVHPYLHAVSLHIFGRFPLLLALKVWTG